MKGKLAALAGLALAGCVVPATLKSEHVLTGAARSPVTGEVRIVMEGAPAPAEFDEIAIVTATGRAADAALPVVLGALKSEAAALGANAVIRVRYDVGTSAASATGVAVRLR